MKNYVVTDSVRQKNQNTRERQTKCQRTVQVFIWSPWIPQSVGASLSWTRATEIYFLGVRVPVPVRRSVLLSVVPGT